MASPSPTPPTSLPANPSKRIPPALKDPQLELRSRPQAIAVSPSRHAYPAALAASPSRLRSSSPRLHSPASTEIFERNVQEPIPISTLGGELSPAHIPAHVITEDHIPPALEASAQAITSNSLNPDEVEIVTATSHQPAAASVLESTGSFADSHTPFSPLQQQRSAEEHDLAPVAQQGGLLAVDEDAASNYGQLDPSDVRRLSFISFKDIVQSEQQQQQQLAASSFLREAGSRDSLHMGGVAGSPQDRAASPLRSPRSPASTASHSLSGGLITPPPTTSIHVNPLNANLEQSPVRSLGLGSPVGGPVQHGELTIETMRQALRKTASGDLSGVRSAGLSPVGSDDHSSLREPPRSHNN